MTNLRELNNRLQDQVIIFLATGLYLSFIPTLFLKTLREEEIHSVLTEKKWTGAGLIGTLAGATAYLLTPPALAQSVVFLFLYIGFAIVVSDRAEKILGSHDDSRIVIDEWVGVWIALWGLGPAITVWFILAVLLFRFFDVMKGPWGHALQKLPGGWGVVMDDVCAGILANLFTRLALRLTY